MQYRLKLREIDMCVFALLIQRLFRSYPGLYDGFLFVQNDLLAPPSLALPYGPRALSTRHPKQQEGGRRKKGVPSPVKGDIPGGPQGSSLDYAVIKVEADTTSFST